METWPTVLQAFDEAARCFAQTVPAAEAILDEEALGEWTVRDLIGHTSRALLTVETYLGGQPNTVQVPSAADYFRLALASIADPAEVAQRGRDAGVLLGDDLVSAIAVITQRVSSLVNLAAPHDVVVTPVGGMRLIDYLPTRTFELTVHTCDLAAALKQPLELPESAAAESLRLVGDLALGSGQASTLLRAATGRRGLPTGFTVL